MTKDMAKNLVDKYNNLPTDAPKKERAIAYLVLSTNSVMKGNPDLTTEDKARILNEVSQMLGVEAQIIVKGARPSPQIT